MPVTWQEGTIQAVVNVRVPAVAPTPEAATEAALDTVDLHDLLQRHQPTPKVAWTEYPKEVREVLADKAGDEECENSRWFRWFRDRWTPAPTSQEEEIWHLDRWAWGLRNEPESSRPW